MFILFIGGNLVDYNEQLSESFTLGEMTRSNWASANLVNNQPDMKSLNNLELLCQSILQPLRNSLGQPIRINSGYRNPVVNKGVGGVKTSAHIYGLAADITCPQFGDPVTLGEYLVTLLQRSNIKWDQIIYEHLGGSKWLHVAVKHPDGRQRMQVLTIDRKGTREGLKR